MKSDLRYLELLSLRFPSIASASTEIINLEAILNLPKGTEHFLADLHGEHEAFQHVLRNASGAVSISPAAESARSTGLLSDRTGAGRIRCATDCMPISVMSSRIWNI